MEPASLESAVNNYYKAWRKTNPPMLSFTDHLERYHGIMAYIAQHEYYIVHEILDDEKAFLLKLRYQ